MKKILLLVFLTTSFASQAQRMLVLPDTPQFANQNRGVWVFRIADNLPYYSNGIRWVKNTAGSVTNSTIKDSLDAFALRVVTSYNGARGSVLGVDSVWFTAGGTVYNWRRNNITFSQPIGGGISGNFVDTIWVVDGGLDADTLRYRNLSGIFDAGLINIGGGGGGAAAFGSITGNVYDQTNLRDTILLRLTDIFLKAGTDSVFKVTGATPAFAFRIVQPQVFLDSVNNRVTNVFRKFGTDSVFIVKNGLSLYSYKDSSTNLPYIPSQTFSFQTADGTSDMSVKATVILRASNAWVLNDPIAWIPLTESDGHGYSYFKDITVASNYLQVNYSKVRRVLNVTISPDENMAQNSVTVGPTVNFNQFRAFAARSATLAVRLQGNGTGSWVKNGKDISIYDFSTYNTSDAGTGMNVLGNQLYKEDYDAVSLGYIGNNAGYRIKRVYFGTGAYNLKFIMTDEFGNPVTSNPTSDDVVQINGGAMTSQPFNLAFYDADNKFMGSFSNLWVNGEFLVWMVVKNRSSTGNFIKWFRDYAGATQYKLYRATNAAFTGQVLIHTSSPGAAGTTSTYIDDGLTPNTLYYYKLVATVASVDEEVTQFNLKTLEN